MRIQHNITALNASRQYNNNTNNVSKNIEKLSSGYRINRAGDDAAGLAISEKMRGQIRGLDQASNNAQDGISLVQTAEGGLNETQSILQRMRELAVQSGNGTYQDEVDRTNLNKELTSLKSEVDRISTSTNFNKINLLDGSLSNHVTNATSSAVAETTAGADGTPDTNPVYDLDLAGMAVDKDGTYTFSIGGKDIDVTLAKADDASAIAGKLTTALNANKTFGNQDLTAVATGSAIKMTGNGGTHDVASAMKAGFTAAYKPAAGESLGVTFQIGANNKTSEQVVLNVGDMSTKGLGIDDISIDNQANAKAAIDKVDAAINTVSGTRADLGAMQNRLEHTVNNLGTTSENLSSAESRIRDVDMASAMVELTKNNILSQASQAMLAQANTQPQGVLQLLQ